MPSDKFPKKFKIVATLRGPIDVTVEDAKRAIRYACPALDIISIEEEKQQ